MDNVPYNLLFESAKLGVAAAIVELGWMIPKDGTLSRKIYGLLVQGKGTTEIASALGIKIVNSRVLAHKIRNPEAVSAKRYNTHNYKAA